MMFPLFIPCIHTYVYTCNPMNIIQFDSIFLIQHPMKILMNSHIFPSEIPILSPFEDILSPEIFIWQVFIQPTWLIAPPDSWAPVLVRPAAGVRQPLVMADIANWRMAQLK